MISLGCPTRRPSLPLSEMEMSPCEHSCTDKSSGKFAKMFPPLSVSQLDPPKLLKYTLTTEKKNPVFLLPKSWKVPSFPDVTLDESCLTLIGTSCMATALDCSLFSVDSDVFGRRQSKLCFSLTLSYKGSKHDKCNIIYLYSCRIFQHRYDTTSI